MSIHVAKCRHADPVFCEARVMATEKGEDRVGVGGGGGGGRGEGGGKGKRAGGKRGFTQLAEGLLEYRTTGWEAVAKAAKSGVTVLATAGATIEAGADPAVLLLFSPKTDSRIFSTSEKTSSGGGTALILWALPSLAYLSTTGMLSSVNVLNLHRTYCQFN